MKTGCSVLSEKSQISSKALSDTFIWTLSVALVIFLKANRKFSLNSLTVAKVVRKRARCLKKKGHLARWRRHRPYLRLYIWKQTWTKLAVWLTLQRTNEPVCPFGSFFSITLPSSAPPAAAESQTRAFSRPFPVLSVSERMRRSTDKRRRWVASGGASLRWFRLQRADKAPPAPPPFVFLGLLRFPANTDIFDENSRNLRALRASCWR